MVHYFQRLLLLLTCVAALPLSAQEELKTDQGLNRIAPGRDIQPSRTSPVFKGGFSVALVPVAFPDTVVPSTADTRKALTFGSMTDKEYFVEYSQNIAWPESYIPGESAHPRNVFIAPQPLGYYCKHDHWTNPIGWKDKAEGNKRAGELKAAAKAHSLKFKAPAGIPMKGAGPHIVCYSYEKRLKPKTERAAVIGPAYGDRKHPWKPDTMCWEMYEPKILWAEPLWPNSTPQVFSGEGGSTYCHELGHVLGAPDYYHAPERNDGLPGDTCLGVSYGPTGPAYCRYIHNAFLKVQNYPTVRRSGQYTLSSRGTNPAGEKPVGLFVPSNHLHYQYYLEYVSGEKAPLGNPGKKGLLVHVINLTLNASFLGPPDLCYTYRPNDPWFRSKGSPVAFFGKTHGRTSFDMQSNPSSRLPNLLDGGVSFDIVQENTDSITIDLKVTPRRLSSQEFTYSLLPKTKLDNVDEILPTSFRAHMTVTFRGEPLLTDYGFVYATRPQPTLQNGTHFPMYHRDRYNGRALGLSPQTKYYVRAYARNENGVTYSEEEQTVVTAPLQTEVSTIGPLLDDDFSANWYILKWHSHARATDDPEAFVGATALMSLLKLSTYYRLPPSLDHRTFGKTHTDPATGLDYTRIHTRPSDSRPEFRLEPLDKTIKEMRNVADQLKMRETLFDDGFNKRFESYFKMKPSIMPKRPAIEQLTKDTLESVREGLRESLLIGHPVLIGQEPDDIDPSYIYGLSWVIIDGVRNGNQFHVIYPDKREKRRPKLKRKNGWYSLDSLLENVLEARVFWGVKPDYGLNYTQLKAMPVKKYARQMSVENKTKLTEMIKSTLAAASSKGKLQDLPMKISKARVKVILKKAAPDGTLTFQAQGSSKEATLAFNDLATADHLKLAHLLTLVLKENSDAHALVGAYAESIGRVDLAEGYYKTAGKASAGKFDKMFSTP